MVRTLSCPSLRPTPLYHSPLHSASFLQFGHINAFFPTLSLLFYIISDLHRHFGATSAGLFMETKPRRTSYLQRMTFVIPSGYELRPLIYTSTGTTDRRPAELVSFHTKLEEKPKIRVIFKCGGFASGIKIRLDSAALHRRSFSSSRL